MPRLIEYVCAKQPAGSFTFGSIIRDDKDER